MYIRVFRDRLGEIERVKMYDEENVAKMFEVEARNRNERREPDPETDELPPRVTVADVDVEVYKIVDGKNGVGIKRVKATSKTEQVERVVLT